MLNEQNNYKQISTRKRMEKEGNVLSHARFRKGQTTIFIIVAILIVVFGILIYFLYPKITSVISGDLNPSSFLMACVEDELTNGVDLLSKQGSYSNPEGFIWYKGNKVKYLCYTSQYYLPCQIQQPLLKRHFQMELENMINVKTESCVDELKQAYERKGYVISGLSGVNTNVEIALNSINVEISAPMTITKNEVTQSFESFDFMRPSKLYSLLMTSVSIIDYESTYGDSETTLYMAYYPNLKIEKTKLGDGSTIYTLSDVTAKDSFTFASRSVAWPPGFGATT